jgi:hypothetical protein
MVFDETTGSATKTKELFTMDSEMYIVAFLWCHYMHLYFHNGNKSINKDTLLVS